MYKLLNMIWKSEFMGSNLLQCDTLLAVAYWAIGSSLARRPKCAITKIRHLLHYTSETVFCSIMDCKVI